MLYCRKNCFIWLSIITIYGFYMTFEIWRLFCCIHVIRKFWKLRSSYLLSFFAWAVIAYCRFFSIAWSSCSFWSILKFGNSF